MTATRSRAVLRLGGWFTLVVAVTVALGRTGTGSLAPPPLAHPGRWGAWLAARDPVTAVVALMRIVALVAAWYLLVATAAGVAVRAVRVQWLVLVADRLTVPVVRRLVAATAGLTLASGVVPALAFARPLRPPAAAAAAAPPATTTTSSPPADPPPTLTMRLLGPDAAALPAATPSAVPPPSAPADIPAVDGWTVRPGECFWSIAEDVLQRAWNRPPTDAEIVPYWRALIEANRARLGDPGNPDLIFPAQLFTVPAPPPG